MKFHVTVTLKNGVLDPQGLAIENALPGMGITGVATVRQGKFFEIEADRRETVEELCERLLANTVVEDWKVSEA